MKKYWFYIDSYIHIAYKKDMVLFYNPYSGDILEYGGSPIISSIARRLKTPGNLQVIRLDESDLEKEGMQGFIDDIRTFYMGDLLDVSWSKGKPIQMPPVVKLQKDIANLKMDRYRSVGEDCMRYLSEISLYVTDSCDQNCRRCRKAFKQFLCCRANASGKGVLEYGAICSLLEQIKDRPPLDINILGGNLFMYGPLDKLVSKLDKDGVYPCYYLYYLNGADHHHQIHRLKTKHSKICLQVDCPIDKAKFRLILGALRNAGMEYDLEFIITSEEEYLESEKLTLEHNLSGASFIPFYNGMNLDFFRSFVFITRGDIKADSPSLNDLYARGKMNPANFGKLAIMPDGNVYANVNDSSLGKLGEASMPELIYRELSSGKSWMRLRRFYRPCKQCPYNVLCPPVTNYEFVLKRHAMCHIRKDTGS